MTTAELVILVHSDGRIQVHGGDLPDMTGLVELVGPQPVEEDLQELGLDVELNHHLCG